MGKRRCPRPINRHTSTKAAGFWGPWRSALAPWLRLEAKFERALGSGVTVGVLGTGVPRLPCLRHMGWLHQWPGTTHHLQQTTQDCREADDAKTFLGAVSLGWLPRSRDIYARGTLRGSRDVCHDDQGQARASGCSVPVSFLVLRRQVQARSPEESAKGFHSGATRPRPPGRQDRGHCGAHCSVTTRGFCR